jgi:hypothetical protein
MAGPSHSTHSSCNLTVSTKASFCIRPNTSNLGRPQQKRLETIEVIARSASSPQASRDRTLFTDSSSALSDTEFDFDHELINTTAYRRALRSFFRGSSSRSMMETPSSPTLPDEETEPANKTFKDEDHIEDLITGNYSPDPPGSDEKMNDLESRCNVSESEKSIETAIRLESMRVVTSTSHDLALAWHPVLSSSSPLSSLFRRTYTPKQS